MKAAKSIRLSLDHGGYIESGAALQGKAHLLNHYATGHTSIPLLPRPPMMPLPQQKEFHLTEINEAQEAILSVAFRGFEKTTLTRQKGKHFETFSDSSRLILRGEEFPAMISESTKYIEFSLNVPKGLPSTIPGHAQYFCRPLSGEGAEGVSGSCSIQYELEAFLRFPGDDTASARVSVPVPIQKETPKTTETTLSLDVSPVIETPNFLCGFIPFTTTKTFSLERTKPLAECIRLRSKQALRICINDPNESLGHDYSLTVKLTQKARFRALRLETEFHFDSWTRKVDSDGMVSIPAEPNLRSSYQGPLVRFWHSLIVYVLDHQSNAVIATTQPIPVDFV